MSQSVVRTEKADVPPQRSEPPAGLVLPAKRGTTDAGPAVHI